jgi:hypothetical protein
MRIIVVSVVVVILTIATLIFSNDVIGQYNISQNLDKGFIQQYDHQGRLIWIKDLTNDTRRNSKTQ